MEEPEPELAVPWSPADPSELSRAQTMEMGLGDLSAQQQFGLSSTIAPQPPLQMKVYLAHDDAMMDRQFGDTDLAKWIAKLLKSGASNPSPSPETNIHHQMEDEDVEVKLLLRGPQDESHLPAVFDLVPTQGSLGVKGQTKCRTRSTYWKMESEAMDLELQLLWKGPSNEKHLDECVGVFDHYSHQIENQFHSLNVKDGEVADEETNIDDLDIEDYMDPSMLGCFFPNGSLGHGRRGPRRTSTSVRVVKFTPNFGLQEPSTSGGRKHGGRKNNDHWTQDEVRLLVNGVSEYGVGKWRDVRTKYFLTSIRTPVHLKDKWKNLVKACKKVLFSDIYISSSYFVIAAAMQLLCHSLTSQESGRMLLPLEQSLIERIMEIDDYDPYPKQSNSAPDRLAPTTSPDLPSVLPPARWSVVKARTERPSMHKSKNNNQRTSIDTNKDL
nr:uncharacterized protein LOC117835111 isoform X3 [Setaria viridis]